MPSILVTNDDGISSPGIRILADALRHQGDVFVVAPSGEQSAVAHSLTLHRPLKYERAGKGKYSVNGTPTDCVILAVNKILPVRPDIVVSGINNGGNLGDNITYSGTVAAAMEGTLLGIPSLAVSLVTEKAGSTRAAVAGYRRAAEFTGTLITKVLEEGLPRDTLINVNVPVRDEIAGVKMTKQGKLSYDNGIQELRDPHGRVCYWIGGGTVQWERDERTDLKAVHEGYISVTPVHLDLTNYDALNALEDIWKM